MGKRFSKIKDGENKKGIGLNKLIEDHDPLIKFSYKYLNLHHGKFNIDDRDWNYFFTMIQRMQNLSRERVSELQATGGHRSLRFHDIRWEDTSEERFGIPREDEVVDKPWQFELSVNEHGRVHGFFIGNVFYIVWLDPEHRLYS